MKDAAKVYVIGEAVPIDSVPVRRQLSSSKYQDIWDQVCSLKRGLALPLTFKEQSLLALHREKVRKLAKRDGELLSTARSEDGLVLYMWIEPKEGRS